MARLAPDALLDVDAVVEVNEVGKIVDTHPVQRLAVPEAGPDRFEERRVGEQNRMTVHARLGRRNSRERRGFDRRMTVRAVDAVVGDVVHVADLERLLDEDVLAGDVARSGEHNRQQNQAPNEAKKAENADFGKCIGASTEYLRHLTLFGPTTACSSAYTENLVA